MAHRANWVFETYDSSYLKFDAIAQIMYFPDGTKMKFGVYSYDTNVKDYLALPIEIKDRNGNFITIAYKDLTTSVGIKKVIDYVTDTAGHSETVDGAFCIGADGIGSIVRQAVGAQFVPPLRKKITFENVSLRNAKAWKGTIRSFTWMCRTNGSWHFASCRRISRRNVGNTWLTIRVRDSRRWSHATKVLAV